MDKQLTLDELKEMHGKPVWCRIPSDNPRWGIVDAESSCVVLGANHRLIFHYYGEWKAFTSPDPIPSPTIKPGDKVSTRYGVGIVIIVDERYQIAVVKLDSLGTTHSFKIHDLKLIESENEESREHKLRKAIEEALSWTWDCAEYYDEFLERSRKAIEQLEAELKEENA